MQTNRRNMATIQTSGVAKHAREKRVVYPDGDGKPMAESGLHAGEMLRLFAILRRYYTRASDIHIGCNQFLYYEEGNPRAAVAPDVYVALGVPRLPLLRSYKLWEQRVPPTLVIEVTSPSTRREDQRRKWDLYARLGVREYVLYDPLAEYLHPPLQGYRLAGDTYEPMAVDPDGALLSEALGLGLAFERRPFLDLESGPLQFYDRTTGMRLLSAEEFAGQTEAAAAQAQAAADRERQRADLAEARLAELERLLSDRPQTE